MNHNSTRFLNAYAAIEHEMKRILGMKEHCRFYRLVCLASRVSPVIKRYQFDLCKYSDLRNAIVHDRAEGQIIAEPNEHAVENIERIAGFLLAPPKAIPLFQKPVLTFGANVLLIEVMAQLSKHAYSQAPVKERGAITGLITSQLIVRWLGANLNGGNIELGQITAGQVLHFCGGGGSYRLVPADTSLFEVLELFYCFKIDGGKLEAVLLTHHGEAAEPLLGIITNRDLPLLQKELEHCRPTEPFPSEPGSEDRGPL